MAGIHAFISPKGVLRSVCWFLISLHRLKLAISIIIMKVNPSNPVWFHSEQESNEAQFLKERLL